MQICEELSLFICSSDRRIQAAKWLISYLESKLSSTRGSVISIKPFDFALAHRSKTRRTALSHVFVVRKILRFLFKILNIAYERHEGGNGRVYYVVKRQDAERILTLLRQVPCLSSLSSRDSA